MAKVTLQLPEDVFSALRRSPEEFARDLRLAAAIHWYKRGEVSQEKAARIAGMDRTDSRLALAREKADAFAGLGGRFRPPTSDEQNSRNAKTP